ncbi:hypothetical protein INR49_028118 [Caranx melampygus]|nr:hypothetical protein INR49_028118 [Caranx melampygus]
MDSSGSLMNLETKQHSVAPASSVLKRNIFHVLAVCRHVERLTISCGADVTAPVTNVTNHPAATPPRLLLAPVHTAYPLLREKFGSNRSSSLQLCTAAFFVSSVLPLVLSDDPAHLDTGTLGRLVQLLCNSHTTG